jgi:hypothetical protein
MACAAVLLLAAWAALGGASPWDLCSAEERDRAARLDRQLRDVTGRLEARVTVARQVAAGRLSLAEGLERYRAVHAAGGPALTDDQLRGQLTGDIEAVVGGERRGLAEGPQPTPCPE